MTVTDELRRMLDERGVEWEENGCPGLFKDTKWQYADGMEASFTEGVSGTTILVLKDATPERAIAATLGPAARHPKPHEQWTTVLLPEIAWNWDDRWPDYLSVAHDAHGEWRVYVPEATLGPWTCRIIEAELDDEGYRRLTIEPYPDATSNDEWFGIMGVCSECGEYVPKMRYCPNCGRKVVDE